MKPFVVHMAHRLRYEKGNPHPAVEHIEVHVSDGRQSIYRDVESGNPCYLIIQMMGEDWN